MAIPVILKGETPKPIPLALKEGYDYSGCCLHVEFCGLQDTFINLEAGGRVDLRYTAEQTAVLPLGTSKVMLSLENANGEVRFMPWAKIKVTDSPADLYDGVITIDPATLDVDDLTAGDSLGTVKSRLNAVMAFLRALKVIALAALPFVACADVAPLYTTPNDMPGDAPLMTNAQEYVDAKVASIPEPDFSTSNDTLVATIEAKAPAPDFSTSNETLVATIEATAPTPTAEEIGAVAKDFVVAEYDSGKDYKAGDVVRIGGKFYVFVDDWRHQWGGNPLDYEALEELTDLGEVIKYRNAKDFLQLGYGGTNAPSYKKVFTGWDNNKPCYFTFETTGWLIDGPFQEGIRMINQEIRVTTNNWSSYWRLYLPKVLHTDNVVPLRGDYLKEENKDLPTSPFYVYTYLTNNYLTKAAVEYTYLTKTEAGETYITETAADGKYSTPAGVASAISSALGGFQPQYLYSQYGNYRLNVDGRLQRQTHSGANINWTNESTGVTLMYNGVDSWHCDHPVLGSIYFTRSNGVVVCNEYPIIRATEDYPDATVLNFTSPIGTMRAFPNAYGYLSWENCKQFADAASVPNNITRSATDATLVHCEDGSCTNALIYIRQASSSLAGLMTAADKVKLDGVGNYATVSNRAMSALQSYTESDPTISAWAKAASKPSYTASDVGAYSSADGTSLANIVNSWEGYWDGTNVIFEVTNYYGNTSGEIPRLRIKELREGVWQIVWDEANKFQVCETNIMSNVVAYVTGEVGGVKQYAAENFAPMAWGTVTDKGTTNVVGNSVWMTAPETYFAGGTEYQRVAVGSGMICVLTDNGALAKTTGEPGTFRFQDEGGTNYFGFAKSDSYTIGCNTDGITVEGTLVTLRYDVIMGGGDVPIVYWRQSLTSGEWVQLNNADGTATQGAPYTVTWYTSGGSYYAAINCGENASGFFKAETSVAGDVVFETNMKMRIDGGLSCTNTATGVMGVIRPTYNGSTVIWNWSAK